MEWFMRRDGLSPAAGWAIAGGLVVALLLLRAARSERRALLTVAGLLAACGVALLVAGALAANGLSLAAGPVRGIAIFCTGACLLSLVGIAVFRALLPAVGIDSPRILQDVLVTIA